jgi:glycosyltransferase involved in cell wall biosynthesis
MQEKKKILIFIDWFLPGYKAGGPVRSIANMVEYLKDEYAFYIVTRNTDYTEITPYKDIKSNEWIDFSEGVKVYYASIENQNLSTFKDIISSAKFDIAYINGIYSWKFSIMPLIALKSFRGRKIVASRGMLAQSAIDVKGGKKGLFLQLARLLGLYRGVTFHATNEKEAADIRAAIGKQSQVMIADNLPRKTSLPRRDLLKQPGTLRLVSLARISPEKNTLFALECLWALKDFKGRITLDLYGQIYNQEYWKRCREVIEKLPHNIEVTHKGTVDAELVGATIQAYHGLFMPSKGENFGHVILESLMAGRPVLISDQTPWRGLEKESCGWDVALDDAQAWRRVLSEWLTMEQEAFDACCNGAFAKAERFVNDKELVKGYERLL